VNHPSGGFTAEGPRSERGDDVAVRTFLIADVRGYTRFTQEQGDEAAGALAASFAELTRETILSSGGEVIELRGDEALCVFASARQALRAAVELQQSLRRQTDAAPAFPLPIGIGLDAGEAVPIEGGYRGGALNTAARLCSLAGPGQTLATDTVISLARRLEGIRFLERRPVRLKGLDRPVRVIEVVPEAGLPPLPALAPKKRPQLTRASLAVFAGAGVALVAAIVGLALVLTGGSGSLSRLDANALGSIDSDAVEIDSQVPLPGAPSAITAGDGFVWIASQDENTVSRYEPASGATQTLSLGGRPGALTYGAGSLWVTKSEERALVQVNPRTSAVVQTFAVGNRPGALAVGEDAVWVVNAIDGTLSRIDLARGSVTNIPVGASPAGVAVGAGAVWIASEGTGSVVRVDPDSRTIVQAVNVGNGPTGIAVENENVWVSNSLDGTVSRIDSATNSVLATIPVGSSPSALAADGEAVWVASSRAGTITRIDSKEGEITETLTLGSSPSALALADGTLWASALPPLAGHRGGVLQVESEPSACRCADPAFGFPGVVNDTDTNVAGLVYDGLVAYRRVAGVAGARVVPDLAARLPALSADGKTYSFQLRRGLRYSDGTPVRASDFRLSMERLLTINADDGGGAYEGIVGAAKCLTRKDDRCDLSKGIEVDDKTGTIVIRLTEPDPDFLHKLALPLASTVPKGTPFHVARARPAHGTGPYRVASLGPDRVRLVRNPHFRSWSAEARSDGYPDEIRFHLSDDVDAGFRAVEEGAADWASLATLPAERLRGVLTRYADRLHSDAEPFTFWLFLNTRVPPFDDERVRRAVNYAADRGALVERAGGTILGSVTCQIIPQGFPGHRPYCPFTRNPNPAGTWSAPDLAKARALVAASRTKGIRIEVQVLDFPQTRRIGRYFMSLLRQLGYRSSLRTFADGAA
jgi:YVTN family beta-propeller protein